ncbi:MAG: plasmid pRiA4b ORF-3 family protein [Gemmatimonadales bacterium]
MTLREVEPPVWRRLEVPDAYTFWDLHVALQDAMGWQDCHLHAFRIREPRIGASVEIGIPDEEGFGPAFLPGWEVPVLAYVREPGQHFEYEYDFGDGWVHDVVLEDIAPRKTGAKYPRCAAGGRACPPEDCGGPPGYELLLAALVDPGHPEHDDFRQWAPEDFDPARFDPAKVRFSSPKRRWQRAFGGR